MSRTTKRLTVAALGLVGVLMTGTALAAGSAQNTAALSVAVRVDGEPKNAAEMFRKLPQRGARRGVAVREAADAFDLRVLILARGPQWRNVIGVAASGTVAVLAPGGDLLFMDLRQKEATSGGAMDRLADAILDRLPALLRGDRLL